MKTVQKLAIPLIIVAAVLGAGLGLLLGWQVWPVQWYDTDPSDLRPVHQQVFIELVADSYAVTGQAEVAARRLLELTDEDTSWAQVANLVETTADERAASGDEAAALRIRRMAQAAQLPAADAEPYVPRPAGALPSTRSILLVAAIVAFVAALAMLIWVVVRLLKGRRPARDALGRVPEGYEVEELPLPTKAAAKILWEEPVADSEPATTRPLARPPAARPPVPVAPASAPAVQTPEPPSVRPTAVAPTPSLSPVAQSPSEDEELEAIFAQAFKQSPAPAVEPAIASAPAETPASDEPDEELAEPSNDLLDIEEDDAEEDDWAAFDSELLEEIDEEPVEQVAKPSEPLPPTPAPVTPARSQDLPKGALGRFEAEYQYGDDDFDCSFTIETPDGEFLGECGVGISDVLSADGSQRVNAFEVWLFDKSDIRTVSKVLVSEHTFQDPDLNARLSAKGDLVMARQGIEIVLETLTLEVSAVVTSFGYLPNDTPSMAAFNRLAVDLVARQVD